jgi:hypothetical protein
MRRMLEILIVVLLIAVSPIIYADVDDLVGDWHLETTGFAFGGATSHVHLTIEKLADGVEAYIYDGPVPIRLDGDAFEIDMDWATGFDTVHLSTFRGQFNEDGTISGQVDHNDDRNFLGDEMRGGQFSGERGAPRRVVEGTPAEPVDLGGVWNRAFGLGAVRKLNYAMTDSGQAVLDGYEEMDNANSRCASMGMVMASGMPYPMEIMPSQDHILIVYGADYVRRIYIDGREFPDTESSSSLGFSRGEWVGDTLVVKTTKLNPSFMSTRGQPISADAYTIEHFYLDDKGYLHADMWLHDPVNYARPPHLRRVMDRDFTPRVITKVGCDPYTFFRALYLDGNLDEFWDRAKQRR